MPGSIGGSSSACGTEDDHVVAAAASTMQQQQQQLPLDLSMFGFTESELQDTSSTSSGHSSNGMNGGSKMYKEGGSHKSNAFNRRGGGGGNMTECVPVPSSEHVAEIVGRQGCKIKALRAKTNTYIKTPVRGEEPVFVVTGRKEDVGSAKREILSAAEHFSQIRASRRQNSTGSNSSVGSLQGPPSPSTPGQVSIQVRVPYRVVGLVVGPKGATIKRIQQQTHTYIVTPSRDKEPVFEVTGTADSVEKARQEIESHIALRTGGMMDPNAVAAAAGLANLQGHPNMDAAGGDTYHFNDFHSNGTEAGYSEMSADLMSTLYKPPSSNSAFTSYSNVLSNNTGSVSSHRPDVFTFPNMNSKLNEFATDTSPSYASRVSSNQRESDEGIGSPSFDQGAFSSVWSSMTDFDTTTTTTTHKSFDGFYPGALANSKLNTMQAKENYSLPNVDTKPAANGLLHAKDGHSLMLSAFAPQSQTSYSSSGASLSGSTSSSPTDSTGSGATGRRRACMMCAESEVVAALVPCGHNLFCMGCATQLLSKPESQRICPVCQQTPTQAIRIKIFSS